MAELTTSDGISLHYEIVGPADGPPLIFSNSLGTNCSLWDHQVAAATGLGFCVIRYDQRGHGQSDAPEGKYTLERLSQDAIELFDALNITKAAFCGISLGGMTGMWLATHHPGRLSRMALCNTAAIMPPPDMWDARIKAVTDGGMEAIAESVVERWFTNRFRRIDPAEVERIRGMILATKPAGYAGCCAAIRNMDQRDALATIKTPTLVVVGDHDPATPPERGDFIAEHVAGAQKAALNAAHLSNIERRDDFNRQVLGFLAAGSS